MRAISVVVHIMWKQFLLYYVAPKMNLYYDFDSGILV
jgi:hypothetical protein